MAVGEPSSPVTRMAARGEEDRVVAEAAADVEDLTRNAAQRFEFHQSGLGLLDVPRDAGRRGATLEGGFAAIELFERFGAGTKVLRR